MKANRLGRDADGVQFKERYPNGLVGQGISAELIAAKWGITREAQDVFSLLSHQRAAAAEDAGITQRSILPVTVPTPDGPTIVSRDEGLRRETTVERLGQLKAAYENAAMVERFPQIRWSVTAGNASQISDGASAALIMEEGLALKLGLKPRAAITHFAVSGDDPIYMLTAIIPATRRLLQRAGLKIDQIDAFEVNEAFAPVPLAWIKELGADPERVNRHGGAIALGHPVGASGGRLLSALLAVLETDGTRYGLQTMCESGGMANATLIERL